MNRNQIIRMAWSVFADSEDSDKEYVPSSSPAAQSPVDADGVELPWACCSSRSQCKLVNNAWQDGYWIITQEELERFAALVVAAEREACCSIVYGQCGSDNVAQRTVDAIRERGEK